MKTVGSLLLSLLMLTMMLAEPKVSAQAPKKDVVFEKEGKAFLDAHPKKGLGIAPRRKVWVYVVEAKDCVLCVQVGVLFDDAQSKRTYDNYRQKAYQEGRPIPIFPRWENSPGLLKSGHMTFAKGPKAKAPVTAEIKKGINFAPTLLAGVEGEDEPRLMVSGWIATERVNYYGDQVPLAVAVTRHLAAMLTKENLREVKMWDHETGKGEKK